MSSVQDLTNQAGFVFEGQIEQMGASIVGGFPASSETAVVRVTKILKSSPALAGYRGQRITILIQPPVSLASGQSAVFFTEGVYYGDGLVVREFGNVSSAEPAMEAQMKSAIQTGDDSEVKQRVAQAALVVSGTASQPVRFVSAQVGGGGRVSEHDALWQSFTINIETVEKGLHAEQTVQALFASSTDIAWYRSPKVKAGDRGVWLLQNRDPFGQPVPGLAVVHPLDFRPIGEQERIRSLIKGP